MSINTMITKLSLEKSNGTYESLISGKRTIDTCEGLIGYEVRQQVRVKPGRHGVTNDSRFRDSPPIVINGQLYGKTAEDAWTQYAALSAACATAVEEDRKLRWTGGSLIGDVEREVRLVSLSPPVTVHRDVIYYQLTLRSEDPRSYSQSGLVVDTSTLSMVAGGLNPPFRFPIHFKPAGGGEASFTVLGFDSTPVVIEIHGLVSGARVVLQSTGEQIRLTGSVEAGRYVTIDTDAREIRTDDGLVRNSLYDYAASSWWELPPGLQTVQLFASTFDAGAFARIYYRPAYS